MGKREGVQNLGSVPHSRVLITAGLEGGPLRYQLASHLRPRPLSVNSSRPQILLGNPTFGYNFVLCLELPAVTTVSYQNKEDMGRKDRKMIYKTPEEIERSRAACLLVTKTLAEVGKMLRPGLTGLEIDAFAETFIRDHGAVPGFKGLYGCPSTLLVSRNEEVVHGLPDEHQVFQDGDILSIDCGTIVDEFYGDAAYTFCVGDVAEDVMELCRHTKHSLYLGIDAARAGKRVGDISFAIQHYTEKVGGYGVVRELVGHGLGRSLHEAPDVPNFGKRGRGPVLKSGLIIAIEPMTTQGRKEVHSREDGWTIVTRDGKPAAHYEHSIAISPGGAPADLMSDHRPIEAAIRNNPNLKVVDNIDDELVAIYQPVPTPM